MFFVGSYTLQTRITFRNHPSKALSLFTDFCSIIPISGWWQNNRQITEGGDRIILQKKKDSPVEYKINTHAVKSISTQVYLFYGMTLFKSAET